jgi:hypothetical protein
LGAPIVGEAGNSPKLVMKVNTGASGFDGDDLRIGRRRRARRAVLK